MSIPLAMTKVFTDSMHINQNLAVKIILALAKSSPEHRQLACDLLLLADSENVCNWKNHFIDLLKEIYWKNISNEINILINLNFTDISIELKRHVVNDEYWNDNDKTNLNNYAEVRSRYNNTIEKILEYAKGVIIEGNHDSFDLISDIDLDNYFWTYEMINEIKEPQYSDYYWKINIIDMESLGYK